MKCFGSVWRYIAWATVKQGMASQKRRGGPERDPSREAGY